MSGNCVTWCMLFTCSSSQYPSTNTQIKQISSHIKMSIVIQHIQKLNEIIKKFIEWIEKKKQCIFCSHRDLWKHLTIESHIHLINFLYFEYQYFCKDNGSSWYNQLWRSWWKSNLYWNYGRMEKKAGIQYQLTKVLFFNYYKDEETGPAAKE